MPEWLVAAPGAFWLDQHSGSVTAATTIVLAVITAIYVLLTKSLAGATESLAESNERLLRETRRANDLARDANTYARAAVEVELDERVRRQASLFSAWVKEGHQTRGGKTFAVTHHKNASAQPIFDCFFRVLVRGSEYHAMLSIVDPDEDADLWVDIGAPPALGERASLEVTFTDNAGVRWRREPKGELSQIPDPDDPS